MGTIFILIIGSVLWRDFYHLITKQSACSKIIATRNSSWKKTSAPTPENKHDELFTEHHQLMSALKDNMNRVQDYLIKLHSDIKALKKYTGLKTPKRIPTTHIEPSADKLELENNLQQLDELKTKLQHKEASPIVNHGSVENDQWLPRPTTLIQTQDYIMPKRDEKYVESFPMNQFL